MSFRVTEEEWSGYLERVELRPKASTVQASASKKTPVTKDYGGEQSGLEAFPFSIYPGALCLVYLSPMISSDATSRSFLQPYAMPACMA